VPLVSELGGDLVWHEVVVSTATGVSIVCEVELVVDDQERSAGGDGPAQESDRGRVVFEGQDAVVDRHEVEGAQHPCRLDQSAVQPGDRGLRLGCRGRGALECYS
jgi:hypothetical protein